MNKMGAMNAEDMKNYKGVFVFAQQVDNKLSGISFELIGEGKRLADKLNVTKNFLHRSFIPVYLHRSVGLH